MSATNMPEQHSVRIPWKNSGLPLVAHGFWDKKTQQQAQSYGLVSGPAIGDHPDFEAAKFRGNMKSALAVVFKAVSKNTLSALEQAIGPDNKDLIFVAPFLPKKSGGNNVLGVGFAHFLSSKFQGEVATEIYQTRRVGRKSLDAVDRVLNQPAFAGDVQAGGKYVLVDDNGTTGGTLASLRGYIESKGGTVVCATVLSTARHHIAHGVAPRNGKDFAGLITSNLAISSAETASVLGQVGHNGNKILQQNCGFGIAELTRVEADIVQCCGRAFGDIVQSRIAHSPRAYTPGT